MKDTTLINSTILIDTNVFLDVFLKRDPFYEDSNKILELCSQYNANSIYRFSGGVAAHSIPTMWYILRKVYSDTDLRNLFEKMFQVFTIAGLDSNAILSALQRKDFPDFEDCLQDECATSIKADFIVTRNPKDYVNSRIPAMTPKEFLGKVS